MNLIKPTATAAVYEYWYRHKLEWSSNIVFMSAFLIGSDHSVLLVWLINEGVIFVVTLPPPRIFLFLDLWRFSLRGVCQPLRKYV